MEQVQKTRQRAQRAERTEHNGTNGTEQNGMTDFLCLCAKRDLVPGALGHRHGAGPQLQPCLDGRMDRWMDARTDGRMNKQTDGWTDGRMGRQTDGMLNLNSDAMRLAVSRRPPVRDCMHMLPPHLASCNPDASDPEAQNLRYNKDKQNKDIHKKSEQITQDGISSTSIPCPSGAGWSRWW